MLENGIEVTNNIIIHRYVSTIFTSPDNIRILVSTVNFYNMQLYFSDFIF